MATCYAIKKATKNWSSWTANGVVEQVDGALCVRVLAREVGEGERMDARDLQIS